MRKMMAEPAGSAGHAPICPYYSRSQTGYLPPQSNHNDTIDWPDRKLILLASSIEDRGVAHNVLQCELSNFRSYIHGVARRRLQAIKCGLVPVLVTCIQTAPDHLVLIVIRTLRELTTDLEYYPLGVDDRAFIYLCESITRCKIGDVESQLHILKELTRFRQGQHSAFNTHVHTVLLENLARPHGDDVISVILEVCYNIAQNALHREVFVHAGVLTLFRKAIALKFLSDFQERDFRSMRDMDIKTLNLMWKMALSSDIKDSAFVQLPQLVRECPQHCELVLSKYRAVMSQWSKLIEVCVEIPAISDRVSSDFIETSYMILRYGELNPCVYSLVRLFQRIDGSLRREYKNRLVHSGIVSVLLERIPIKQIWRHLTSEVEIAMSPSAAAAARDAVDSTAATDTISVIASLLEALPKDGVQRTDNNINIVECLVADNALALAACQSRVKYIDNVLSRLATAIERLFPGWCECARPRPNDPEP